MRFLIPVGLTVLFAVPLGHAQQTAPSVSTRPVLSETTSWTAGPPALAPRPASRLTTVSPNGTADSTRTGLTRRDRRVLGGLHLTIGALGLGGGTVSGIGAYQLLSGSGESEWAVLGTGMGIVLLGGAASLIGTGIYMTIRGIRILQGKAPPVGWRAQPSPSPPPRLPPPSSSQPSGLTLTVSF